MTADHNSATNPTAVFYRRTLIDLDKARAELIATGGSPEVLAALDAYRASIQSALHTQGAAR